MRTTCGAICRLKRAVGCAALALLLCAAPAGAATTLTSDGASALVTGSAQADEITANVIPNPDPNLEFPVTLEVVDPGGVTVQAPCSQGLTPDVGLCQVDVDVEMRGGAGDDTIVATQAPAQGFGLFFIQGEEGSDRIRGSEASDSIAGGLGDDLVDGGAGDDVLGGGLGLPELGFDAGADRLYGGPGSDSVSDDDAEILIGPDILSGGACPASADATFCSSSARENPGDADIVLYPFRTEGVSLDLGSSAPEQGQPNEGDTVLSVEDALTGDGPDLVTGNGDANFVSTGAGDDRVEVQGDGANTDQIFCHEGTDTVVVDVDDVAALDCEFSVIDGVSGGGGGPVGGADVSTGGGGPAAGVAPGKVLEATIKGASAAGTVKVASNGSVTLSKHEVQCPAGSVPCFVKTSLSGAVKASTKKRKTVKLGGSVYAIAAGKQGAVKLKLTAKGMRLLRRSKRVRGTVTITVTKGTAVTTKKVKVTLKAPKKKKRTR
jgi:RTX calcium-binding nonapeptide repeat (4 copies)